MRIQDYHLEEYQLSSKAVLVFSILLSHMNYKTKECWPSLRKIAAECCISVSSVQRGIKELLTAGLIGKKARYRDNNSQTSNLYIIIERVQDRIDQARENMNQLLVQRREYIKSLNEAKARRQTVSQAASEPAVGQNAGIRRIAKKILFKLNSPLVQIE